MNMYNYPELQDYKVGLTSFSQIHLLVTPPHPLTPSLNAGNQSSTSQTTPHYQAEATLHQVPHTPTEIPRGSLSCTYKQSGLRRAKKCLPTDQP